MFLKAEYDRLLNSLTKIGIHFAPFLKEFYLRVFSILPRIVGEFKCLALQLVLLNVESIPNLFQQLQPELNKLLIHRDEETQLLTLQVLHSIESLSLTLRTCQRSFLAAGSILPGRHFGNVWISQQTRMSSNFFFFV